MKKEEKKKRYSGVSLGGIIKRVHINGKTHKVVFGRTSRKTYGFSVQEMDRRRRFTSKIIFLFPLLDVAIIAGFLVMPFILNFLGFLGTVFVGLGLGIEIYLFIYRILQMGPIAGRPLLVLGALLLIIGIQMISIGLLGEMIIFTHAEEIEEYNIEEIVN